MDDETKHEKAKQLAVAINLLKPIFFLIDLDFAKLAAKEMIDNANRLDSMAVLNPRYNPEKTRNQTLQAKTLMHLVSFIEGLIESDETKQKIKATENMLNDLFPE